MPPRLPTPKAPGANGSMTFQEFVQGEYAAWQEGYAGRHWYQFDRLLRWSSLAYAGLTGDTPNYPEAVAAADDCSSSVPILLALAELMLLPEPPDRARALIDELVEEGEIPTSGGEEAGVAAAVAWSYQACGELELAQQLAERAAAAVPNQTNPWDGTRALARYHLLGGRPAEALAVMERDVGQVGNLIAFHLDFALWFARQMMAQGAHEGLLGWLSKGRAHSMLELILALQPTALEEGVGVARAQADAISGYDEELDDPICRHCLAIGDHDSLRGLISDRLDAVKPKYPLMALRPVSWMTRLERWSDDATGAEEATRRLAELEPHWREKEASFFSHRPWLTRGLFRAHVGLGRPVEEARVFLERSEPNPIARIVREELSGAGAGTRGAWATLLEDLAENQRTAADRIRLIACARLLTRIGTEGADRKAADKQLAALRKDASQNKGQDKKACLRALMQQELGFGAPEQAFLTARKNGKGYARDSALREVTRGYTEAGDLSGAALVLAHHGQFENRRQSADDALRIAAAAANLPPRVL